MKRGMLFSAVLTASLVSFSGMASAKQAVDLAAIQGWNIVMSEGAIPSEAYAAEEFQNLFEQASGVELPIVSTTTRPNRHVFIGAGPIMKASVVGFDVSEFGEEDLRIVIRDDNIAIAGGPPRGTLYGVYTFFEDYLGVRFLTAAHTYVPKLGQKRVVGPADHFYHPPLSYRHCYYGENMGNPTFAARMRNNAVPSDAKLGGKTGMVLINHSFASQIPSSRYGKEHPEYYCEINGKRLAIVREDSYDNEPCLTNPDVLRIVTEHVLKTLEANPQMKNISVSQNDNDKYCRCAKCRAIDEREGTPMGTLLTFVNAVADEVAKKHPGVKVGTLSYWYSRKPPKTIRPRPNVQIQLCSIECCLIHPIDDLNCPKNVEFCRDMADWGDICDDVRVWNYNTNFRNFHLPLPNLRVIAPNVKYFVANNAKGIFMQAAYASGAELSDLRNYMISNLLWDPTRSGQQLMDEFLDLHYGRAARPIRGFINLVHDNAEAKGLHPDCFGNASEYGVDETIAAAGLQAFAEAMELADDETIRRRVEKASVCAYRAAIEPVWILRDSSQMSPELARRMRPLTREFFALCDRHRISAVSEGRSPTVAAARERLRALFGLEGSEQF